MSLTPEQIKGRIRNKAKENNADARVLIRIYMMERFLERLSVSSYKDYFIIKGGVLVTSMVGISMRSTMDIDTTIKNMELSEKECLRIINEISAITLNDGVSFRIREATGIMDEMEYPGIRITMDAILEQLVTPIKIDISTGDIITPKEIRYKYNLMLEDRAIQLWTYNLETILAEKIQTILARGLVNTRMRDFYDLYILSVSFWEQADRCVLKKAFMATCQKRGSVFSKEEARQILFELKEDIRLEEYAKIES